MFIQNLLLTAAALLAYGLFRWRLMRATHDLRVAAGREALRWAASPHVPDRSKASLLTMSERMYQTTAPWLALAAVGGAAFRFSKPPVPDAIPAGERTAQHILRLNLRLILLLITTSPLASAIGVAVVLSGLAFRICVMSRPALTSITTSRPLLQALSRSADAVFLIRPGTRFKLARHT